MSDMQKTTIGCLGVIAFFVLMYYAIDFGERVYGDVWPYLPLVWTCITLVLLAVFGFILTKGKDDEKRVIKERQAKLSAVADKYNAKVSRASSSHQYSEISKAYNSEAAAVKRTWAGKKKPVVTRIWYTILIIGFVLINFTGCFTCGMNLPPDDDEPEAKATSLMDKREWSAENIPMPHMESHELYVSNPDEILSEEVVDSINATLLMLDDQLGIETAMVIVGHIKNDDPIEMVSGIYEKYGVGRDDRGLVIVVGYLDHSYFIAPGRNLEADLTDAETDYLAQEYLIPSMKAELPDSGMLYLARGVYALMAGKDTPQMATLSSSASSDDDYADDAINAYMLFFFVILGWLVFAGIIDDKVGSSSGARGLHSNPFSSRSSRGGSSSSSSSYHSSSSSSSSSGGYGGGSWGGGGSGGRW